jgi:hypothetical protein
MRISPDVTPGLLGKPRRPMPALLERQTRMHLGSIRAAYGASGVTAAGSPLDVLEMSVANAERDRQQILYKGELKALGYEDTRTLSLFGADSAKKQAEFSSFSQLLTGVTGGRETLHRWAHRTIGRRARGD